MVEPTLIWPTAQPTARSASQTSSVSPDRADTTAAYPAPLVGNTQLPKRLLDNHPTSARVRSKNYVGYAAEEHLGPNRRGVSNDATSGQVATDGGYVQKVCRPHQ